MTGPAIDADAFNAFEAAAWERRATGYDRFFGAITSRLAGPLLDAAAVGDATRALDVATGPGYVARAAADRGAAVIGVDVAEAMVALAGRLHPDLDVRLGDAHALPFPDGSFDAVVANFLLLHSGAPERAVAEFARVLAPGGRVALTVWDVPERAAMFGIALGAVGDAGAVPPGDLPVGPDFFRFSDDEEFDALLAGGGLADRNVETIAFTHRIASADELWEGFVDGTARTAALILGQTAEMQRAIRAAFDRRLEPFRDGDGFALPVSVKLASARRP
jgi:SAM-dependent methyltransferase